MSALTINPLVSGSLIRNPGMQKYNSIEYLHAQEPCFEGNYATNSVWRAFQAGMGVLYQYAGRSNADPILIAKANLRLLHQTLLNEPSYRDKVMKAEHEIPNNGNPAIVNLLTMDGLTADLMTLQQDCETHLTSCDQYNRMVMIIVGKVSVYNTTRSPNSGHSPAQGCPATHKSWWGKTKDDLDKKVFGQEDVILLGQNDHKEKRLNPLNHCVLLNISLSVIQSSTAH